MALQQPVTSVCVISPPRRRLANLSKTIVVLSFVWRSAGIHARSTAVSSIAPPTAVYDLEPLGKKPEMERIQPLVNWLPIWGQSAREKGFDLPLPFGLGLTYTYIHQNMVISDVKIEGRQLKLKLPDAPTTTSTGVFRADVWLFPFLNVYGLVGETAGTTEPSVVFSNGKVLGSTVDYNRPSYGAGMTLAGGYKDFFLTLDANWTTGPIVSSEKGQIGDEPIQSITIAPRFGILMSSGKLGIGSLWIGGMCLKATSEIHDKIDLSEHRLLARLIGEDSLDFSVHVEPKDQWNLLMGGNWEFNKRWSATAEVGGVLDRFHVITALMFRF
jgi:hypothetical protein